MKSITLRNIDEDLDRALKKERMKTGRSINSIILEKLKTALIPTHSGKKKKYDDLASLAGTWTDRDAREFSKNTAEFENIDESIWK